MARSPDGERRARLRSALATIPERFQRISWSVRTVVVPPPRPRMEDLPSCGARHNLALGVGLVAGGGHGVASTYFEGAWLRGPDPRGGLLSVAGGAVVSGGGAGFEGPARGVLPWGFRRRGRLRLLRAGSAAGSGGDAGSVAEEAPGGAGEPDPAGAVGRRAAAGQGGGAVAGAGSGLGPGGAASVRIC